MKTIAQQLKVKEFPFVIENSQGKEIYYENSTGYGYWSKKEYNAQGNPIYFEDSTGYWSKKEYNAQGNPIYFEDSTGYWSKKEYNAQGNLIYFEDSNGKITSNRPKKTILSIDEIAQRLNIPVDQLQIKK